MLNFTTKQWLSVLLSSILAYTIRFLIQVYFEIDLLDISVNPCITFFSITGFNGLRILIKEWVEYYFSTMAMSSNPRAWAGNPNPVGALPPILNPTPNATGSTDSGSIQPNPAPNATGNTTGTVPDDPNIFHGNGFSFNTATGVYNLSDPSRVADRLSYNSPASKQPYATNLANALEDHDKRVTHKQIGDNFNDKDIKFWNAFCETQGQGKYNWNSKAKRLALKRLP